MILIYFEFSMLTKYKTNLFSSNSDCVWAKGGKFMFYMINDMNK